MQKQPLELLYKKAVPKTSGIFTGKYLCWRPSGLLQDLSFTRTLKILFFSGKNVKLKVMFTEAYLEPSQTSTMEVFCKNSYRLVALKYFHKMSCS